MVINFKFVFLCEGILLYVFIDLIFFYEKGKGFLSIGYDLLFDLDLIDLFLKSGLDVNFGLMCLYWFLR